MKLTDIYNFYDGILPYRQSQLYTENYNTCARILAKAAEREYEHLCQILQKRCCSKENTPELQDYIKYSRNQAVNCRSFVFL